MWSGYYHIQLTKEAAEKVAFVTDKGIWIFYSLPFGINIGPLALGKDLVPCTEFALNYLNDSMIFSGTWEEHLKAVFKWLEAAKLKIKCSKCVFFKTKVHYLGFLVGIDDIQPLPEKAATIQALLPLKDINKPSQFLGLVVFLQEIHPVFFCR